MSVVLATLACAHGMASGGVHVRVLEPEVTYVRSELGVHFAVTAVIANDAASPSIGSFGRCGVVLQKQFPAGWHDVVRPICFSSGIKDIIAPGDSIRRVFPIGGSTTPNAGPAFHYVDSIPGTYRLLVEFAPLDRTGKRIRGGSAIYAGSTPFTIVSPRP